MSCCVGAAELPDDQAVGEEEDAVGDRGRAGLVRDHDERLPVVGHRVLEQLEDLAARLRVEVAGRLVGEHDGRLRDERARDGDALLLAAGELGGAVAAAVVQADLVRAGRRRSPCRASRPAMRERQEHVLVGGQHRQQVEELEDEADVLAAQLRDLVVLQLPEARAGDRDVARRGAVERGEDVHQGRLAGARRAHDRGQLALRDVQVDAAEGVDGGLALAVAAGDLVRLDDRAGRVGTHRGGCGGFAHACKVVTTQRTPAIRITARSPRVSAVAGDEEGDGRGDVGQDQRGALDAARAAVEEQHRGERRSRRRARRAPPAGTRAPAGSGATRGAPPPG